MQKSIHETTLPPASSTAASSTAASAAAFPVVLALTFTHLLNDLMQSLLPAIYPIIKDQYGLSFGQIGLITLAFQLTASLLQPVVGIYTDRKPRPYSLVVGMALTLIGLVVLARAGSYSGLLIGAALIGTGSSVFHPEATRMARLASGGRHGFAQSLFQVGGQTGQAIGPLLAAFIVVPYGQSSLLWFSALALTGMLILWQVGNWYAAQTPAHAGGKSGGQAGSKTAAASVVPSPTNQAATTLAIAVLVALMFSKSAYTASLSSYYTFYLIGKYQVAVQTSQMLLFLFLIAQVVGSLIGGHLGDRFGRRQIIWFSILGALPFTLALPYVGLTGTVILTTLIGMIMASAFPAMLVYAMDLLPGRIGTIAGVFYGVTFGLGALSAALLGVLADVTSLDTVYRLCSYLPLIGLLAWFLPKLK
jgi:MFS transporter, FSR family, fosmidomycin resistance protein